MKQATKKRRLSVTLDPLVFEALRETSFRRRKPLNFLIENALRKYLSRELISNAGA